ncbi:MAG: DUF3828 domain-containing protein [Pyrinomonadaceae bacterium]
MKYDNFCFALLLCIVSVTLPACSIGASNTAINVAVNTESPTPVTVAGTPASAGAESQTASAEALVADLYKQHDAKKSPFFQTKNRALVDKYFTKPLADLIWKDANDSSGEVGAIDGDPLYNAQDMEIKNFAIGKADAKGETAIVPVTFTNFGQKQTLNFALKRVAGAWKIDNIKFSAADSLMKWLNDTYNSANTPADEANGSDTFEGRYLIGDTTCKVKPVKMAYEVRWAKGKGVEMFFAKDETTFESSPAKGGVNSFSFDNNTFSSGTFQRADGKEFAIKRAK